MPWWVWVPGAVVLGGGLLVLGVVALAFYTMSRDDG